MVVSTSLVLMLYMCRGATVLGPVVVGGITVAGTFVLTVLLLPGLEVT
jgi:hypothetical protein